jgi:threonine dehydrogenase-like Zn-dependent dehydrogenase
MNGTVRYAPRDVRLEGRAKPQVEKPTDAVIRISATCVCGSDLWAYRGIEPVEGPRLMGHDYVGIVEEIGRDVRNVKPGQFVVGSFFAIDNTCEICQAGYQSACLHREYVGAGGAQGPVPAGPVSRRHPRRHTRGPLRRPRPEPARRLRRARHGLLRRCRRRGWARQNSGSGR